jgi:hypothetical protein
MLQHLGGMSGSSEQHPQEQAGSSTSSNSSSSGTSLNEMKGSYVFFSVSDPGEKKPSSEKEFSIPN